MIFLTALQINVVIESLHKDEIPFVVDRGARNFIPSSSRTLFSIWCPTERVAIRYDETGKERARRKLPKDLVPLYYDKNDMLVCKAVVPVNYNRDSDLDIKFESSEIFAGDQGSIIDFQRSLVIVNYDMLQFSRIFSTSIIAVNTSTRSVLSINTGYDLKYGLLTTLGKNFEWSAKKLDLNNMSITAAPGCNSGCWTSNSSVLFIARSTPELEKTSIDNVKVLNQGRSVAESNVKESSRNLILHLSLKTMQLSAVAVFYTQKFNIESNPVGGKLMYFKDGNFALVLSGSKVWKVKLPKDENVS